MDKADKICEIAQACTQEPHIWDDNFYVENYFEHWQDATGEWEDTLDVIEEEVDDYAVLGWSTRTSLEDTQKLLPQIVKDFMANNEKKTPYYKQGRYYLNLWERKIDGFTYKVLEFPLHDNDDGWDYVKYWYLLCIK